MRRRGFTLIELLVVIAIISILASMLMPVFSRAEQKGYQAACISNEKQIIMACLMYAEDYDEILPPGQPNPTDPSIQWYQAVQPYTHNYDIFYCPSRKDTGPGYGLNWLAAGVALGAFYDSSRKILIADAPPEAIRQPANPGGGWPRNRANPNNWWVNDPGNDICGAPADDSFTGNNLPERHNDGTDFGYVDGHVKWSRERNLDQREFWVPGEAGL